jgi:hypothetical protein
MRKTLTIVVAALAIGLTGCTRSQDDANTQNYPQEAKDNFVDRCAKQRGGDQTTARKTCGCIIDALENRVRLPYDTKNPNKNSFKDADMALKDGKPLSPFVQDKLNQATAGCKS